LSSTLGESTSGQRLGWVPVKKIRPQEGCLKRLVTGGIKNTKWHPPHALEVENDERHKGLGRIRTISSLNKEERRRVLTISQRKRESSGGPLKELGGRMGSDAGVHHTAMSVIGKEHPAGMYW